MDKKNFTFSGKLLFVLLIFNTLNVFAQWQTDVRLTNDPSLSYTSYNNTWCIASNGNVLHVVWQDYRDGNLEIYYKRSTDGGVTWGTDVRLTNDGAFSENPSVAVSGQIVHVIWQDNRQGAGNDDIFYKRSSDGGATWGADIQLTNDAAYSQYSSLAVSGSAVHIVWHDTRDSDYEIYYKHSTDGGISWSADMRLTNSVGISYYPSIAVNSSLIHVVWYDNRGGNNYHIYYKHSTDNGVSWGPDTHLSDTNSNSADPCISVSGSLINVVWEDNRDGNIEVYYKRSTDGGSTWGADARLTNNTADSRHPSVASSGSIVHIVWDDNRDGYQQLYYKRSTDGGATWSADTRITNTPPFSAYPSVSLSGTAVHIVWQDSRDGNLEIYYKRDPTGNPAGIINIGSVIPKAFSLSQNYPNPFNPSTKIQFAVPKSSFVKMVVYDISGKEIETLVNQNLNAGEFIVDWGASNYSSGVYLYKITAGSFTDTKKMILIK